MDAVQEQASALRPLASQPPNPELRSRVDAALASKFEGVQSVALDVLGAWGDADSKRGLSSFLTSACSRESGWAIRSVAVRNLAPLMSATDVEWVLALYFSLPDALLKHELVRLVIALPAADARPGLIRALGSVDPLNRQAAVKAIGNMPYADRRKLIWPLRDDPDRLVSKSARLLSREA